MSRYFTTRVLATCFQKSPCVNVVSGEENSFGNENPEVPPGIYWIMQRMNQNSVDPPVKIPGDEEKKG